MQTEGCVEKKDIQYKENILLDYCDKIVFMSRNR